MLTRGNERNFAWHIAFYSSRDVMNIARMSATARVNKLQSRRSKREILYYKLHAASIIIR